MAAYSAVLLGFLFLALAVGRHLRGPLDWVRAFGLGAGGIIIGTSLIWCAIGLAVYKGQTTWAEGFSVATNRHYNITYFWQDPVLAIKRLGLFGGITLYEFPSLLLVFSAIGIPVLLRRIPLWSLSLLAVIGGTYLFSSTFLIQRAIFVLLPVFMLLSYFGAIGLEWLHRHRTGLRPWLGAGLALSVLAPILVYPATANALQRFGVKAVPGRELAHRDNTEYFLVPSKRSYDGPEKFARDAFAVVPPGGCLVADFTPMVVLAYYKKQRDLGSGVELIFSERLDPDSLGELIRKYAAEGGQVFLADNIPAAYHLTSLPDGYEARPVGSIYVLEKN